jgi:hypothetical protein
MGKIVEIEGIKAPEKLIKDLGKKKSITSLADELNKLPKNDRRHIVATIGAIIERSESGGSKRSEVPDRTPGVRTPASNDEGILGNPGLRSSSRPAKTVQQATSN